MIQTIEHSTWHPINLILNCSVTDVHRKDQWINFYEKGVLVGRRRACTCKKQDYDIWARGSHVCRVEESLPKGLSWWQMVRYEAERSPSTAQSRWINTPPHTAASRTVCLNSCLTRLWLHECVRVVHLLKKSF